MNYKITFFLLSLLSLLPTTIFAENLCSTTWQQCGGVDWLGPKYCCSSQEHCIFQSKWHSHCQQISSPFSIINPTPLELQNSGILNFCPEIKDLTIAYGSPKIFNQGWTISNGGGVATLSTFNLIGGSIEFDLNFSGVNQGVNANIYSIFPTISATGYMPQNYCDGAGTGSKWCTELDWIESNGHCGGRTTLHTKEGTGIGCTAWGCSFGYLYGGKKLLHMKVSYDSIGRMTTIIDGKIYNYSSISPPPTLSDLATITTAFKTRGALVYSSQWVGWVPFFPSCGGNGKLEGSVYTISNLKINGAVVQGPIPRKC